MKKKSTFILMILFMGLLCGNGFAQINTNGGFEDWNGTNPTGWHGSKTNATNAQFAKYTDAAYEGANALQLINTTNSHKRFTTTAINVEEGKRYAISFYAMGKGDLRFGIFDDRSTPNTNGYVYNNYFNIDNTNFTHYTDTILCQNNNTNGEFILSFRNTVETSEHLILDNVYIYEIVDESFVSTPTITLSGNKLDATTFFSTASVSITCSSEDAEIFYTLDGTDPDNNSTLYTSSFDVTENTTVKAVAYKNGNYSEIASVDIEISDLNPIYFENFDVNGVDMMTIFTDNESCQWNLSSYSGNSYAYVNGYNKGDVETWLITPSITPLTNAGVVLSFETAMNYTGYPIMVKYSTNYSGSGDPSNATWTDITEQFTYSEGSWTWINSGDYEIAGAQPLRFAWVYVAADGNAAAWEVDNIMVLPSDNIPVPALSVVAPVDGAEFSTLDTLPVSIQVSNFALGSDGFLKLESPFLNSLGMGNISPLYLNQDDLDELNAFIISPIPEGTHTVTASLVNDDYSDLDPAVSQTVTFTVTAPQLPAPVFAPASGTFADSVVFSLSDEVTGATIRYTTDGTTPDENSTVYTAPITLHETTTVKAVAYKENYSASDVATAEYTVVFEPVLTVSSAELQFNSENLVKSFVVSGAHLTSPITLTCDNTHFAITPSTISEPNNNTEVNVTFDGEEPADAIINIVSGELTASVNITATAKLAAPVFTPASATSEEEITVTLTCDVTDANIRYTMDGTEPTSTSALYSEPIVLTEIGEYTIKAIAEKENWENSDVATATYAIVAPSVDDTIIYYTGFEASEGFEASTTYNNTSIVFTGSEEAQWGTYYGTPSVNNFISGAQSMQMRWYTSATENLGYTFTNFDLNNVTHISFKAANSNGLKVKVSHSIDGGSTYSAGQTFDVTSQAQTFDYTVSETGENDYVRLKFSIVLPETTPNATSRLVIDEVTVYGVLGVTPTTVSAPEITPTTDFYYDPQTVTITCANENAVIRYTTDGTEPTESSAVYSEPFTVATTTTIKAKAWVEGMTPSFVSSTTISFPVQVENIAAFKANASNDVQQIMSDVTFVFRNGRYIFVEDNSAALLIYDNSQAVITTEYNEGDIISGGIYGTYKPYNGMIELAPTHNSAAASSTTTVTPTVATIADIRDDYATVYESKLVRLNDVTFIDSVHFVQGSDTIAIFDRFNALENTIESGLVADVIGFVAFSNNNGYVIYPRNDNDIIAAPLEKVANPEFSFQLSGEFYFMDITCATEGADIYYTVDGTDPDESSYHFTSQVPLYPEPITIKAVAMKEGMANSDIVTYYFVGLNDIDNTISIYPNPATDYLMVNGNINKIEIFNNLGQLVKSEVVNNDNIRIDISNFVNGSYIIRAHSTNGVISTTFIKR